MFKPTKLFFTKGVGKHKDYLQSFELALRQAGIEKCNIVTVSIYFLEDARDLLLNKEYS